MFQFQISESSVESFTCLARRSATVRRTAALMARVVSPRTTMIESSHFMYWVR